MIPAKREEFCIGYCVSKFRRTIMTNGTGTVPEIRPQTVLAHLSQFAMHYSSTKIHSVDSPTPVRQLYHIESLHKLGHPVKTVVFKGKIKRTPCNTVIAAL